MSERRARAALAGVVVVGAALRVAYAVHVGTRPLLGDGLEFHLLGNALADGRGYVDPFALQHGIVRPTADKPPLYPATLALLSLLGLRSPQAHHASGVTTGTLTILAVAVLARAVSGRREVGLLAGAACAIYPPLVMADGSLRSESLFALLVCLTVLAAVRYRRTPGPAQAAAVGALAALAALTRGEAVLLAALLALGPLRARRWADVAAGAAALALVLAPWLARDWARFGEPVAISTNVGGLVAGANCDATYHGPLLGQWSFGCVGHVAQANEARAADALRRRGWRYARAHAGRLPVVLLARLGRTFELYRPLQQVDQQAFFEGRSRTVARLALPAYYLVALLAAAAAWAAARGRAGGIERGDAAALLAPVAMVAATSLLAYGYSRFRVGAEPPLIALAACGGAALTRARPARRAARAAPAPPG
jgi:hypothetical protein